MRLDRVEVEGFRGIDRLTVDLDELTTVIGEPDCGKSSLLRAVARVLGPGEPDPLPRFATSDFHRRGEHEARRAATLAITLGLIADDQDQLAAGLPGIEDGGVALRVMATRAEGMDPATSVEVVDRVGLPIDGIDGEALLARLRRRHPAVIVGGPRPSLGQSAERGQSATRLRSLLLGAAEPEAALSIDELEDVREDLLQAGGRLAEHLHPMPEHPRTVWEMTETPRALVTDLSRALKEDAGHQRRIAALWLLVAILDAVPEAGLGTEAEPILLFDDIEANLHPTWLAAMAAVALNLPFQRIVATHSPEMLAWVPLSSLRRLVRGAAGIDARRVMIGRYAIDELRRLTFHVRLNRGGAFFARCWILVEGETEAWLLPELALQAGVELPVEGIRVIDFAQCGVEPLLKAAQDLGIGWLVLADGDQAGSRYTRRAQEFLGPGGAGGAVVVLPAEDIEHYLYRAGYADVIRGAAGGGGRSPGRLIKGAVENVSKPGLALMVLAEADRRGPDGVPPVLREVVETALRMARG